MRLNGSHYPGSNNSKARFSGLPITFSLPFCGKLKTAVRRGQTEYFVICLVDKCSQTLPSRVVLLETFIVEIRKKFIMLSMSLLYFYKLVQ